jgi:hypothetical protein
MRSSIRLSSMNECSNPVWKKIIGGTMDHLQGGLVEISTLNLFHILGRAD